MVKKTTTTRTTTRARLTIMIVVTVMMIIFRHSNVDVESLLGHDCWDRVYWYIAGSVA